LNWRNTLALFRATRCHRYSEPTHCSICETSAWARLLRRGLLTSPIRIALADAPFSYGLDVERLVEIERTRFGRPRQQVERKIEQFLGL
jgi:hypothetical protein